MPFGTNTTLPAAEQRHIAAGAREGALPAWILQAVRDRRLSHVLLLTRHRGEVRLLTGTQTTIAGQRGRVDGIGFYLDAEYKVRDPNTGAVSNGALGPRVLVELALMETDSAKVVRSHTIDEQFLPRRVGVAGRRRPVVLPQRRAEGDAAARGARARWGACPRS